MADNVAFRHHRRELSAPKLSTIVAICAWMKAPMDLSRAAWGKLLVQAHRAGSHLRPRNPVVLPRLRSRGTAQRLVELLLLALERGADCLVLSHPQLAELAACSERCAQDAANECISEGLIERPRRRFHHFGPDPIRGHRERSRVYKPGPVLLALIERARRRGEGPAAQRMRVMRAEARAELAARRARDERSERARRLPLAPLSPDRREFETVATLGPSALSGEMPEGRKQTPRAIYARVEPVRPQAAAELSTGASESSRGLSPPVVGDRVAGDLRRSMSEAAPRASRVELPACFELEGVPPAMLDELRRKLLS
jgi:hypothetical protein